MKLKDKYIEYKIKLYYKKMKKRSKYNFYPEVVELSKKLTNDENRLSFIEKTNIFPTEIICSLDDDKLKKELYEEVLDSQRKNIIKYISDYDILVEIFKQDKSIFKSTPIDSKQFIEITKKLSLEEKIKYINTDIFDNRIYELTKLVAKTLIEEKDKENLEYYIDSIKSSFVKKLVFDVVIQENKFIDILYERINKLNDFQKYKILKKGTDKDKEGLLEIIKDHNIRVDIICSFEKDELKKKYLSKIDDENDKLTIIETINNKEEINKLIEENIKTPIIKYEYYEKNGYIDEQLNLFYNGDEHTRRKIIEEINSIDFLKKVFPFLPTDKEKMHYINWKIDNQEDVIELLKYVADDSIFYKKSNNLEIDEDGEIYEIDTENLIYLPHLKTDIAKFNLLIDKTSEIKLKYFDYIKSPQLRKLLLFTIKIKYKEEILQKYKEIISDINDNDYERTNYSYEIFKTLFEKNYKFTKNLQIDLFDSKILEKTYMLDDSSRELFILLTKFSEEAREILDILKNDADLTEKMAPIFNSLIKDGKLIDSRLFKVMKELKNNYELKNCLISNPKSYAYISFYELNKPELKLTPINISTYEEEYNIYLDNKIKNTTNLEELKDLYLKRYTKTDYNTAVKYIKEYFADIENINLDTKEEKTLKEQLKSMFLILNCKTSSDLENLKNIITITDIEENLLLENKLKKVYTKNFKSNLLKAEEPNKILKIKDTSIPVFEAPENFYMLVHSVNAYGPQNLKNGDYCYTWNHSDRIENHFICCSHISNDNLALPRTEDILFGFNNFSDESLVKMGISDMGTYTDEIDIRASKPTSEDIKFCSNKTLSEDSSIYHHNEVNIERRNLVDDNEEFLQPSCIVMYKGMKDEQKINCSIAAKQFNIPIVYFDEEKILNQKLELFKNKFKELITLKDYLNMLKEYAKLLCSASHDYFINEKIINDTFVLEKINNSPYKEEIISYIKDTFLINTPRWTSYLSKFEKFIPTEQKEVFKYLKKKKL